MDDLWRSAYQLISRKALTEDEFCLQVIATIAEMNEREARELAGLFLNNRSVGGDGQ
jgi:hypothetical protein